MTEISELARQLYQAILERGYVGPERSWEGFEILDELHILNGDSYDWLRELQKAGLIIRVPSNSITSRDRFYVVPPHGYVPPPVASKPASNFAPVEQKSAEDAPHRIPETVDWTKWGAIFGGLALVATILIAVLS